MAEESEEVARLMESIKAFAAIEDPAKRTEAVSRALRNWPDLHAELRQLRQDSVRKLRDEQGKTWPEIATIIGDGVTPQRAQQIGAGLRGAKRPPKKESDGG